MLLAADRELALEPVRRVGDRRRHVAAAQIIVRQHARAGLQRVLDGDRRAGSAMSILASRAARRAASRVSATTANSA